MTEYFLLQNKKPVDGKEINITVGVATRNGRNIMLFVAPEIRHIIAGWEFMTDCTPAEYTDAVKGLGINNAPEAEVE